MGPTPQLCLGLTVYNGERYLAEAIESALAQNFGDFRLVICDNASTDDTAAICQGYAHLDRRIQYLRNGHNIGAAPNFNMAFGQCQSPFYKWMTHDDLLEPDFLQQCMRALSSDDGAVLAHSTAQLIDDCGLPLPTDTRGKVVDRHGNRHHDLEPRHLAEAPRPSRRFAEVLRRMNWCLALFGVVRSDALRRTNLLGSYYEADRVLLAELALLGRFRQIDVPLFKKRCHPGVSVLMGFADKARMMDPSVPPLLPGLRLRAGYLRSMGVGDLPWRERLVCAGTVARLFVRNPLTYKLKRMVGDVIQSRPVRLTR